MAKKGVVRNPTGKGGFQERPQDRNRGGAPRKGQSWGERIDILSGMTRDELIDFVGGAKTMLGKLLRELPPNIPTRDALILISFIQFGRDPNPRMMKEWMDRVDGKVREQIDITSNGETIGKADEARIEIQRKLARIANAGNTSEVSE